MTVFTSYTFPATSRTRSRTVPDRLKDGAVNAAEFSGFAGDGVTDDIVPLRAAVAAALSEGKGAVLIPAGATCAISDTLLLGYAAAPDNPAFSLALIGGGGAGNHNGQGSVIKPTFNGTAVLVGSGQNMLVEKIAVTDTGSVYRGLQNSSRIGIGVRGGSGGASGFTIRDCHVYGMTTAIKTGVVNDSLSDSGLIEKCSMDNVVDGISYSSSQNYIQNVVGCQINAKRAIYAGLGHNVTVLDSNLSGGSAQGAQFAIGSVSTITKTAYGNGFTYTFTAHITTPDTYLVNSVYDDGCVNLPHFGLVPVIVTAYNSGTQVISLQILPTWSLFHLQDTDLTTTDFDTVNQANTTLNLAERLTMLHGANFTVIGGHLENSGGYTRLLESSVGFDAGTTISRIYDLYCNWDPASPFDGNANSQIAKRSVQKSHPFVNLASGGLIMDGCRFSQINKVALNFDLRANLLEVRNSIGLAPPNIRSYTGQNPFTNSDHEFYGASFAGAGFWEPTPFVPQPTSGDTTLRQIGWNRTQYWGWFPGKDRTPRLAPSQLTTMQGTLPTFVSTGNVTYPLLCGGTPYSVGSETETNTGLMFARSNHKGFSYGQNLTTTNITNLAWSFYGKTNKLVVNVEAFERLFPGLMLSLSHASIGGGTAFEVMVTGLQYEELYVTIGAYSGWILPGTAGTQYTGTTIGQAAYSIKTVTGV